MVSVGVISTVIGVSTAWITSNYDIPFRKIAVVGLVLPFACPAYVVGYVYAELFEYSGPIYSFLRDNLSFSREWVLPIRSIGGAALVISLCLYPYIFLLARASFVLQSQRTFEAARTLGASPKKVFWRIALPIAGPGIIGGIALVLMEAMSDYGVAHHFGIPTLTSGIFRTWFAMGERDSAIHLASLLFILAMFLVLLQHLARNNARLDSKTGARGLHLKPIKGYRGWSLTAVCFTPAVLGFGLPSSYLIALSSTSFSSSTHASFVEALGNSMMVGALAALICCACAIVLSYALRVNNSHLMNLIVKTATLGYAIPGMALAVLILVPITIFERYLAIVFKDIMNASTGLIFTGTVAGLIFVYIARFLTVSFNSIESSMHALHPNLDHAAKTLGAGRFRILKEIHLPLISPAIFSGGLLVFVDVMKELPATLIMRPFNFETLATQVFRLASDERLIEVAPSALSIVAVSSIPVILLLRSEGKTSNVL